jgi:hypothetical protein
MTAAADRARATGSANDLRGQNLTTDFIAHRWMFGGGLPTSRNTRKNMLFAGCAEMGNHRRLLLLAAKMKRRDPPQSVVLFGGI